VDTKKPPGEGRLGRERMATYEIPEELERALDRWIEALPEPRPNRSEALLWALRDFLIGSGVIPYDEDDEEDSTAG
jgi:ABC-type cobalt transport system substrate-binding protein